MIETGIDTRVKVNQIIESQLPSYVSVETPKAVDFLKQYYKSQDSQGSPADLIDNLDQYIKFDNLTPEVISGITTLTSAVSSSDTVINVISTKGYPNKDGIFQLDNEIIYYTGITTNSFTGCIRGFSGISQYNDGEVVFNSTTAKDHTIGIGVTNLSTLFLREYFRNLKVLYAPGFEDESFDSDVDVNNLVKNLKSFYQSKGTAESINTLISILFGQNSTIRKQSEFLFEPSEASFRKRLVLVAEKVDGGDPLKLSGQTLFQDDNENNANINAASAPISEVETTIRGGTLYYTIYLYQRFQDPSPGFEGNFSITPSSRTIGDTLIGDSVITVDSTIGFSKSGVLRNGSDSITYTDKTITQFLGCTGIETNIPAATNIRTNDTVYGFTNDTNERVELRLTGVISEFDAQESIYNSTIGEIYRTKSIGQKILNPASNKTYEQISFNSWKYNTSSSIKVESFNGSVFVLGRSLDNAYLRDGDNVEVVNRADLNVVVGLATVSITGANQVVLSGDGITDLVQGIGYDIRRKVKKASSSGIELSFGNNTLISNVLNTYITKDRRNLYVAANSLPDYDIDLNQIQVSIPQASSSSGTLDDQTDLGEFNNISFSASVPFITGDEIVYSAGTATEAIKGLEFGRSYFVEVQSPNNKIRLYVARSFIDSGNNVKLSAPDNGNGSHFFSLAEQVDKKIAPQKVLKKFSLIRSLDTGNETSTVGGASGILANGVEISNYKIDDKVFFGPVEEINVFNSGSGYDVVSPPKCVISSSDNAGTNAEANVAIIGSLKDVIIDPQDFDIDQVISITVNGGNGAGAVVEPLVIDQFREIGFNGKNASDGGGVSVYGDFIRTINNHNFGNGQEIVYDPNGNRALGVTGFGETNITGNFLETGGRYYTEVIDPVSFRLYENESDYNSGINTVGFSTGSNTGGLHKFRTAQATKQITGVNVLESGSGYENRQVAIQTTGISTSNNSFVFKNHGFSTGELITYSTTGDKIPELSTSDQYYVTKVDDNIFRISNAGVAGTNSTNFDRGLTEKFTGIGTGLHVFNYPPITVDVSVSIANTVGVVTATPIVVGSIKDVLLYEGGTSYGSKVLNFHKRPTVSIVTGSSAEFKAVISDKKIIDILVTQPGNNYFSPPDLVITSESGSGCLARAVVNANGQVTDVIIISTGNNYVDSDTSISAVARGSGSLLRPSVRSLTLNNRVRFNQYGGEAIIDKGENNLQYAIVGYNPKLQADFQDQDDTKHSPLIGWAYDGNPIYGCYGYTDSNDKTSPIKLVESGYVVNINNVFNRPSGFESGLFIEDYLFTDSGDLDKHNGRFTKTPEFPNGTYAYFSTLELDPLTGNLKSSFPYFIGDSYRSNVLEENLAGSSISLTQDFDFIGNELIRNTFPYNVAEVGADYNFFVQPYNFDNQKVVVKSRSKGGLENLAIVNKGRNYQVGDNIVFDNSKTTGGAAAAQVSEVTGGVVNSITKEFLTYDRFVFETINSTQVAGFISTYHNFESNNIVKISGLSTYVAGLSGDYTIGVAVDDFSLTDNVVAEPVGGMVTDLPITNIPEFLRPNSEIEINDETLTVLNVFKPLNIFGRFNNIIRAVRGTSGSGHTVGAAVTAKSSQIIFPFSGPTLDSKANDVVYFNPTEAVGFGTTTGISIETDYALGGVTTNRSIPTYSIYLEKHPFTDNQPIKIIKPAGTNPISVSTVGAAYTFTLPLTGNEQLVYAVNKGPNIIGIKTTLDSAEINFQNCDTNNYQYQFTSTFKQVIGKVERLTARVSTASSHGLQKDDRIVFDVKPNLTVGIGTSTAVRVLFNEFTQNAVVDPIGFSSASVGLSSSRFNIESHGLVTGDLVFYDAVETTGIDTGKYFVFSGDPDSFSLAETKTDLEGQEIRLVNFTSIGGTSHTISKVNPQIKVTRNNNIKFDLSDSSLSGYNFKVFYDSNYRNQLVGTGSSETFEVTGIGTVGMGTASVTIQFNEFLPEQLYYNLEKTSNNTLVESDVSADNFSRILYVNSEYSKDTVVVGLGTFVTEFLVNLPDAPEKDSYVVSEVDKLEYSTKSPTAFGGISKLSILSKGSDYDKLPGISTITSTLGSDAEIQPKSNQIGLLDRTEVEKPGFDFAVDKTLKPVADIPVINEITNYFTTGRVIPVSGGRNFITPPNLVLVNSTTNVQVDNVSLTASLDSGSISSVEVVNPGSGLQGVGHSVFSLINDNGLSITKADSVQTGIMTLTVVTPVLGFSTNPLQAGDEVFVDGIQEYTGEGDGFNSKNYGFRFFEVTSFNGGINPAEVTIDLSGIGTGAPGVAVTNVNFGSIIKKESYPTFAVEILPKEFIQNEPILLENAAGETTATVLTVESSDESLLKTRGDLKLNIGDKLLGSVSGARGTIVETKAFDGFYDVGYGSTINFGWITNRGILNDDTQVVPDNDYYQRLAYSIKSPVKYDDLIGPVNRLAHISGTKNFADTEITSVAVASTNFIDQDASQSLVIDLFSESDVTTNNFFDFAVDTDVEQNVTNISQLTTNSIKFGTKKLTNFIECVTNRVLSVDDISGAFIDRENLVGTFKDIINFPAGTGYSRFTVVITDVVDRTSFQVVDLVVLNDGSNNTFILEKSNIKSNPQAQVSLEAEKKSLGELSTEFIQLDGTIALRFTPSNTRKTYDLKAFRQLFDSRVSGLGTNTIGDTKLIGVTTQVGAGSTDQLVGLASSEFNSMFAYVEVVDNTTSEREYAELTVLHDGVNAFLGQYGFDTSERLLNFSPIGTFGANMVSFGGNNVLKLEFHNNSENSATVKANIVGFTTTNVGLRSEHFKLTTQVSGTERTARLESNVLQETANAGYGITVVGITSIIDRFAKSVVRVSSGNTESLSQVLMAQEVGQKDIFVLEYPQLGINTAIGLGTFSSRYNGAFAELIFLPDSKFVGDEIRIEEFSEIVYSDQDTNLTSIGEFGFGTVIDTIVQAKYTPEDRTSFTLSYEDYPIFARRFNPANSSVFDLTTGNIFLESHFMNTGQDIKYEAGSSIIGINSESITIGSTTAGGGGVIGDIRSGSAIVSGASTNTGIAVGDEFFGPGVAAGATIVSIGNTFRFFLGDSDGGKIITGVANTSIIAIGDTIRELITETGFGTVTAIGAGSLTVANNVPVGVGSTYYSERLGIGITMSAVATATTSRQSYFSGFTTNVLPEDLFVIRIDNNNIKLATKKDFAVKGLGIAPTSAGSGNFHLIDTTKKLEKSLIVLDGVVQAPIARTLVEHETIEPIAIGRTFIALSGISTLVPDYILKIDNELMNILNVGLGTTGQGPISGVGTFNLANVSRGFVGTKEVPHDSGKTAIVHRGAYNIVESDIHFVDTPRGAGGDFILDDRGLQFTRSEFNGRVYLRNDYTTNELYDDISPEFTGIAKTFSLGVNGGNYPIGLDTSSGSGLLFVNGVHQGQSTDNNPLNVYSIVANEDDVQVVFSGTKLITGDPYLNELDAVKNQLPVGGVIVSAGSSGGVGIAPLVGAKVIARVGAGGSITEVVGIDTVGTYTTITNFLYDHLSGIATVTTASAHGFGGGDFVDMRNIEFDCPKGFDTLVGISTVDYDHVSGIMTVTTSTNHGLNKDMRVQFDDLEFICPTGQYNKRCGVSTFVYNNVVGILTVTTSTVHQLNTDMQVKLENFEFACAPEHAGVTTHVFPDGTNGRFFNIVTRLSNTEFETQVGPSTIPHIGINVGSAAVEIGVTTNKFSSDLGIQWGITGFDYTESTGVATITTKGDHNVVSAIGSGGGEHIYVGGTASNAVQSGGNYVHTFLSAVANSVTSNVGNLPNPVTNVVYTPSTGNMVITSAAHSLTGSNTISIADNGLSFTCTMDGNTATKTYPRSTDPASGANLAITATTTNTFTVNVGASPIVNHDVTAATYDPATGRMELTIGSHSLTAGTSIKIANGSLTFTCAKNNHASQHSYPRPSDPFYDTAINIDAVTATTIFVNVGASISSFVRLSGLAFTCSDQYAGVTTHIFPGIAKAGDLNFFDEFEVLGAAADQLTINVGPSTIAHNYTDHTGFLNRVTYADSYLVQSVVGPTTFVTNVNPLGYANTYVGGGTVDTGFTTTRFPDNRGTPYAIENFEYDKTTGFSTITTKKNYSGLAIGDVINLSGIAFTCPKLNVGTPNGFLYNPATGISTISFASAHGLTNGDAISIDTNSITFTCTQGPGNHTYPRVTDFAFDRYLTISNVTSNTFQVNVGTGGTGTSPHTFVSATTNAIKTLNYQGVTTSIFPDGTQGFEFKIFDLPAANKIVTNVGVSTIDHTYDDHGIVFGVKSTGPYEINTIISPTEFVVDVFKVGFAHTFVPNRRRGGIDPEAAKFNYLTFGSGYFNTVDVVVEEVGHSGAAATITATIPDNEHRFVSASANGVTRSIGGTLTVSDADYDPVTGILTLTFTGSHGLTASSNTITIADGSIVFTCAQDSHQTVHPYPRSTDPASGTALTVLSTPTATKITVNVGTSSNSTGGILELTIEGGGSGYTNPTIQIDNPSYADLPIIGVNRRGIGNTTETGLGLKVDCVVGSAATAGFGTALFGITNYELSSPGFSFKKGDIFTPVGLVTAAGITTEYSEFQIEVIDVLNDSFSAWNFGEIDYIDSIQSLQDGFRTRFPLNLDGIPLSFQTDPTNQRSTEIDLDSVLLIFVNGVVQVPKKDYFFEGGTSFNFNFTSPPGASDVISIYFYRGIRGVDSFIVTVFETVKPGDEVQLKKFDGTDTITQDERTIFSIKDSTDIETNVYRGTGINPDIFRPISFTKQKKDVIISEEIQPKIRETLEAQIMPTSKVIRDFGTSDTEIFLESANLFKYEQEDGNTGLVVADALVVEYNDPVAAAVSASVSSGGTITSVNIISAGSGYADGAVEVSIANPPKVDNPKYGIVGVGSTAIVTGSASGGILTSVTISYEGLGYDPTNVPQAIAEFPAPKTELINDADVILGYSGIITGIGTTTGIGSHPLALKFQVDLSDSGSVSLLPTLLVGYPILVKDTITGSGVTSVGANDAAVVGIGTTVLDNIYTVSAFDIQGNTGIITCNIKSDTNTVGIATTTGTNIGEFSWGKLSGFTRGDSPISISVTGNTVDVGLTTYSSISRRGLGLRNTGGLSKIIFL